MVIESPGFAMVVSVQSSRRGKVDLNFLGPDEVKVWRGELFAAIKGFDEYDRLIVESKDAGDAGGIGEASGTPVGRQKLWGGTDAAETADR